jgi:hypothetical protein
MPRGLKAKKAKHNHGINVSLETHLHNLTPHLPRSEAPGLECSEVEGDLEDEDDFEPSNYSDSLKADFWQEDVEDWSDEDNEEAGGDMDELMELC